MISETFVKSIQELRYALDGLASAARDEAARDEADMLSVKELEAELAETRASRDMWKARAVACRKIIASAHYAMSPADRIIFARRFNTDLSALAEACVDLAVERFGGDRGAIENGGPLYVHSVESDLEPKQKAAETEEEEPCDICGALVPCPLNIGA